MCSPASTTFDAAYRTARRTCFRWTMLCPSHLALDPGPSPMDPNRLHLRPLCVTRYRYVYRLCLILRMSGPGCTSSNLDPSRASSEASSSLDATASLDAIDRWWIQTTGSFASRSIFPSSSVRGNHLHLRSPWHGHSLPSLRLERLGCEALTSPSRNTCVVLSPAPRRTSECE